jgi:hypothetical protein
MNETSQIFFADLADTDLLTRKHLTQVDFAAPHADPPAGGDHDGSIVHWVLDLSQSLIGAS